MRWAALDMTPIPDLSDAPFPRWLVGVLWIVSLVAVTLGFRFQTPNERIHAIEDKVEAVQAKMIVRDKQIDSLQEGQQAILSLLCVKSSDTEHRLARVSCPTGTAGTK